MILAVVAAETVFRNAIALVTAALLPVAVLGLPAMRAVMLPSDLLSLYLSWAPLLRRPIVPLLMLLALLVLLQPGILLMLLALLILLLRVLLLLLSVLVLLLRVLLLLLALLILLLCVLLFVLVLLLHVLLLLLLLLRLSLLVLLIPLPICLLLLRGVVLFSRLLLAFLTLLPAALVLVLTLGLLLLFRSLAFLLRCRFSRLFIFLRFGALIVVFVLRIGRNRCCQHQKQRCGANDSYYFHECCLHYREFICTALIAWRVFVQRRARFISHRSFMLA